MRKKGGLTNTCLVSIPTSFIFWFWHRVDKSSKHWLWTGSPNTSGYGVLTLPVIMGGKHAMAHRVSFFLNNGYWPENARHKCDIPLCVRPDHIIEGTQAQNIHDCIRRGRARYGGNKLTPQMWEEIRQSDETQKVLAKRYGVCQGHISMIRSGKTGHGYPWEK